MALHLAPFDPDREFVTQAVFRANGVPWGRGFPFDKSTVDAGLLKKLYENRRITYADTKRGEQLLGQFQKQTPTIPPAVKAPRRSDAHPLDHDSNGEKGGSEPKAGTPEERAARLSKRHNHAELVKRASGIRGMKSTMTKAQLATLLVKHNRDD